MTKQTEDRVDSEVAVAKCSECYYFWKTIFGNDGTIWACDYISVENKRRPCKAGAGCTVFKPKTGRKQYTGGWFHEGRRDDW